MKKQTATMPDVMRSSSIANGSYKVHSSSKTRIGWCLRSALAGIAALMTVSIPLAIAQQASPQRSDGVSVQGTVHNPDGKLVAGAVVRLEQNGASGAAETKTDVAGSFAFSNLRTGSYMLSAEKSGLRSRATTVVALSRGEQEKVDLILAGAGSGQPDSSASSSSAQAMEFADKPNFTVAGVTDWTAVGGHGSDSSLRTSEALASETLTLKPEGLGHSAVSGAGDAHRVAGELAEKRGDPLAAVHEYEQAVRLDPSEQNYFEWGSELLLHRAVWQAQEVFHKGADAYPRSARMLTGLGAALFAGARYDEAAVDLCNASDLSPSDPEPYLFMGRMQIAAPNALTCVEPKLARFVQQQPENSLANYLYAMATLKRHEQSADKQTTQQAEALLTKAVTLDAKCGDGYLQLGILAASQRNLEKAIDFYTKAIAANPQLGDAHYRLGVAYDRIGEHTKAKQEFELHDEIKKQQAAEIERQRREVKQFLIVLPGQPTFPPAR